MVDQKKFLVDVEMRDLPFPMRVLSKFDPDGQHTVANISVSVQIMQEFEARWIDRLIQIVHEHRDQIGTQSPRVNILDYLKKLNATSVRVDLDYLFFVEKLAARGITKFIAYEVPIEKVKERYSKQLNIKKGSKGNNELQLSIAMHVRYTKTFPSMISENLFYTKNRGITVISAD